MQEGKIRAVKGIRMKATVWWAWGREGTKSKDHHTVSLDPASSFPPKSPACQLPLSPAHVAWYLREAGPLEEAQRKGSHIKGSKHPVSKSREGGFPTPKTILQHQLGIL